MTQAASHWTQQRERSSPTMLRLIVWLARTLGRAPVRLLLWPIALYFLLTGAQARTASRRYLSRVLGRPASGVDTLRHFHHFACVALDRIWLTAGKPGEFELLISGSQAVKDVLATEGGAFFLGAHVGSFDVLQAVGRARPGMRVAMVMYPDNARMVQRTLQALSNGQGPRIITIGRPETPLEIRDWLDGGGLVGLMGDRFLDEESTARSRLVELPFLGATARFSDGPMRLAMLLRRRVLFMVGLYRGGRTYDVRFVTLADFRSVPSDRGEREQAVRVALERYVQTLEQACRDAPLNWFNFYDYWHDAHAE